MAKIRSVVVEGDRQRGYKRVQVLFGTHSFIEISAEGGRVTLLVGGRDKGFVVDGSEANGALDKLIHEVMERHPELVWQES